MVDVSRAAVEQRLREENSKLRQALAGHLFDGESASFREVIRSELIQQGIRLDGALANPSDELLEIVATVISEHSRKFPDGRFRMRDVARDVLTSVREFCWSQDAVGHTEIEEVP